MGTYAKIINGVVAGISYEENSGLPEVPNTVFPGDIDNGDGTFSRPVPPAPTPEELRAAMPPLTARQFRLGLLQSGHLPADVEAQIALIADPTEKATAEIEWEYATKFERLHPLVVSISAALGLTAAEVDALWTAALDL